MREILSLFMFGIGALLFVVFFTVFRPDTVTAMGRTSPSPCGNIYFRMSQMSAFGAKTEG